MSLLIINLSPIFENTPCKEVIERNMCKTDRRYSLFPHHCEKARRDRCQDYPNCFLFGEMEETTRTSSYYIDEDYPARPEIKQSLTG